jgi:hypothetical protein
LLRSIYEKHRHVIIYTFLGTTYDGSDDRRGLEPHLKASSANGRTARGRRSRWPGTRPLSVSCDGLAAGKTAQGRQRQARTTGAPRGNQPTNGESGGGQGRLRPGDRAAVGRGSDLGVFCHMCHWCVGPGGGRRGRARTPRSIRADAKCAQIWAAFTSPRTPRSKCVGPLG